MTTENKTRACSQCAVEFILPPFEIAARFVKFCPACSEQLIEEDRRKSMLGTDTIRQAEWKAICPPLYLATDPSKLPSPTKLQRVLNWSYGARGLTLHGATGTGKTRCAWKLLEREWKAGQAVAAIDCHFSYQFQERSMKTEGVKPWLDKLMRVPLLLLDDTLKVKLTDAVEQALFCVVNYRAEHLLPIITTTNDTGDTLQARVSQDRGAALVRRLREFSESIAF